MLKITIQTTNKMKRFIKEVPADNSIFLQIGMKVKIKNDTKNYLLDAGKEKIITKDLPNYGENRAFELDNGSGIWCIEDFEYCVNYANLKMK